MLKVRLQSCTFRFLNESNTPQNMHSERGMGLMTGFIEMSGILFIVSRRQGVQ